MASNKIFILLFFSILQVTPAETQTTISSAYVNVIPNQTYQRSKFHQFLFGKNWRKEWATPVIVPTVMLDTIYGGLKPYQKSGGGESKSLRLKSADGKEYVLRSINKSRKGAVPKLLKNTWFESLIQDGVSMSHPYGAFAVPYMMTEAKLFHPQPRLVYIPNQAALDSFNNSYGADLYLLEERPSGNWTNSANLGGYKSYKSTAEVKDQLITNNRFKADQRTFIRARLFDILVSDVDRHEGNWRWGIADTGAKIFKPIPVDRDQVFFTQDGLLTWTTLLLTRRRFMQNFTERIKNVKKLTLTKRDRTLDRFFTNEMDYNDWMHAARILRQALTDSVIVRSVQQLPPEVFAISGKKIINNIIKRRADLETYAAEYYNEMAKKVDVNGTGQNEYFEVKDIDGNKISVAIFSVDDQGKKEAAPYYSRTFDPQKTKRIVLKGFGGDDTFKVGTTSRKISIIVEKH